MLWLAVFLTGRLGIVRTTNSRCFTQHLPVVAGKNQERQNDPQVKDARLVVHSAPALLRLDQDSTLGSWLVWQAKMARPPPESTPTTGNHATAAVALSACDPSSRPLLHEKMNRWLRRRPRRCHTAAASEVGRSSSSWRTSSGEDDVGIVDGDKERDDSDIDNDEDANERAWNRILVHLNAHPRDLWHPDVRGRTGLHVACTLKVPCRVLRALLLLEQRPEEVVAEAGAVPPTVLPWAADGLLRVRDNHGRTALAVAVANNLDTDAIRLLLHHDPAAAFLADHMGYLPLHLVCSGHGTSYAASDRGCVVERLLRANPRAAGQESFRGETPLHVAVEGRAPLTVIRQLVQGGLRHVFLRRFLVALTDVSTLTLLVLVVTACPRAVVMDGSGVNPLFMAIRCNAGPDIVRCLVDACPQVTTLHQQDSFCLPLRFALECQAPLAVQQLLCTSPDVVLDSDPYVHHTVLHQMLRDGVCIREDTVRLLLRIAPELANAPSKCGSTPTELALERFATLRRPTSRTLDRMWRISSLLLRTSHYGSVATASVPGDDDDDDYESDVTPVLHAVAFRADCPVDVFQYALQQHPEQMRRRDVRGHLPLHLAIQRPDRSAHALVRRPVVPIASKNHAILEMLRLHPDCAGLPATVMRWDEPSQEPRPTSVATLTLAAKHACSISSDAVWSKLVQLQPTQLRVLDPVEALYPFQVAAVSAFHRPPVTSSDRCASMDASLLTTVYLLARQAPDLLSPAPPSRGLSNGT